jgi:hypothetical protein
MKRLVKLKETGEVGYLIASIHNDCYLWQSREDKDYTKVAYSEDFVEQI